MKNIYLSIFCIITIIVLSGCLSRAENSCSTEKVSIIKSVPKSKYVFSSYPENSLNTYNSYWDDFAGSIEEGKVYHYRNKGFSPELQFKVLQVLEDSAVLVFRHRETGWPHKSAELGTVCESALFLVVSDIPYADDAKLREGNYICVGTYTYETKNKNQKTVYVLAEKSYYDAKMKDKAK